MNLRPYARMHYCASSTMGFTLVELLVTIAIIGIMIGMLLPAVQMVRESARRASCQSSLHNIGLALLSFESSHRAFPHGASRATLHSWNSAILPWLEQKSIYDSMDFKKEWNLGLNANIGKTDISIFHCPSSKKFYEGSTDYCGISGSWQTLFPIPPGEMNGMLYPAVRKNADKITVASIEDGTSHTIIVSEGAHVKEDNHGFWACGLNCFSHEEGGVNNRDSPEDEIASYHPSGANAAFCDGSIRLIHPQVKEEVVAALCTRNGHELDYEF